MPQNKIELLQETVSFINDTLFSDNKLAETLQNVKLLGFNLSSVLDTPEELTFVLNDIRDYLLYYLYDWNLIQEASLFLEEDLEKTMLALDYVKQSESFLDLMGVSCWEDPDLMAEVTLNLDALYHVFLKEFADEDELVSYVNATRSVDASLPDFKLYYSLKKKERQDIFKAFEG